MNVVSYPPPIPQHYHHQQSFPVYPLQPRPASVQQNIRLPSIQELIPDRELFKREPVQSQSQSQTLPQSQLPPQLQTQQPPLAPSPPSASPSLWSPSAPQRHYQQQQQHPQPMLSPPVSNVSSPSSSSPVSSQSVPPFHHLPSPPQQSRPLPMAATPHHPHHSHPYVAHPSHHQHTAPAPLSHYDAPRNPAKKRRGNLPRPVTDILRTWLHDHIQHPYPTEAEKNELMRQTGLTLNQISNWFINARRRRLPALHKHREKQRMYSQH